MPDEYKELQAREAAEEAQRQREQATFDKAVANTLRMQSVLERLKKTAGKTWYVFSGSSPSGWDCSGLVMWTYKNVGVTLAHSAGTQLRSGKIVSDPLPGDLVAYVYGNNTRYTGHVGIYLGDGKVIHSQKPGTRTKIESATNGVMNYGGIKTIYVRIIPMVPESDLPKKIKPSSLLEALSEAHGAL
jgi:cell wall-associated NlpC family hydrolase